MKVLSKVLALAFYSILGLLLVGFSWLGVVVNVGWFYAAILVAGIILLLAAEDHQNDLEAQAIVAADPNPPPAIGIARVPAQRNDDVPAGEF